MCTRYKDYVEWICLALWGVATSCVYCEQNVYTSSSVEDEKSLEKFSNCYILKEDPVQWNYKAYEGEGAKKYVTCFLWVHTALVDVFKYF